MCNRYQIKTMQQYQISWPLYWSTKDIQTSHEERFIKTDKNGEETVAYSHLIHIWGNTIKIHITSLKKDLITASSKLQKKCITQLLNAEKCFLKKFQLKNLIHILFMILIYFHRDKMNFYILHCGMIICLSWFVAFV